MMPGGIPDYPEALFARHRSNGGDYRAVPHKPHPEYAGGVTIPAVLIWLGIMGACVFALYGENQWAWGCLCLAAGMFAYICGYRQALEDRDGDAR